MDTCSVDECQNPPEDTHHQAQQHTADQFGNIEHYHKNRKHNLVPLCKEHHRMADKGLIDFSFKMTSDGVKLMSVVINK